MMATRLVLLIFMLLPWAADAVRGQEGSTPEGQEITGPGLHARLFDTHLREVAEICAAEGTEVLCINRFWEAADVSGDNELSIAEITRMLRILSGGFAHQEYLERIEAFRMSPSGGPNATPPESEEAGVVLGAAAFGPILSHAMMANLDYNDNGLLSKAEALHDIAADILLSSVDGLPAEVQSQASRAIGFLLEFLAN